jgi:hypothetical protein
MEQRCHFEVVLGLIKPTMPQFPLVIVDKWSMSLSVSSEVCRSVTALGSVSFCIFFGSSFDSTLLLFGLRMSMLVNTSGWCSCCFLEGTLHFCFLEVQVLLLPSRTCSSTYHRMAPTCLQTPLMLKKGENYEYVMYIKV